MSQLALAILVSAAGTCLFLLALAVAINLALLPRPRCFGYVEESECSPP
jgi:hypothetical protein